MQGHAKYSTKTKNGGKPIHVTLNWGGKNNGPRRVVIGRLDPDGTFVKSGVYRVHTPPSLALDAGTVDELKAQGCKRMRLTTTDGAVYAIEFPKFQKRKFYQTRTNSAGRQAFCMLDDFDCLTPPPAWEPGNSFPLIDAMRAAGQRDPNSQNFESLQPSLFDVEAK